MTFATPLKNLYVPPTDGSSGTWVGRAAIPGAAGGPAVVLVRGEDVFDITRFAATTSALFDRPAPVDFLRRLPDGERLGLLADLLANSDPAMRDPVKPWLLAPVDLQAIKAAGVTFTDSLIERVVEEQAKGDPAAAESARRTLVAEIGVDLSKIKPGSEEAGR